MDKLIVQGPSQLNGEVAISSAKNATLPILAATPLSLSGEVCWHTRSDGCWYNFEAPSKYGNQN